MVTIIIAIAVFLIVIFWHELGHFLVAVKSGIKVNEFSVGMGPKLFQKKKNNIKYSLRALPLGGYVAIEGEDEDSEDPKAFNNAKASKRLAVIVAGVIMNFILGFVILFFVNMFAQPNIALIVENSPAEKAGLKANDIILEINEKNVKNSDDITKYISESNGEELNILIKSNNKEKEIRVTPSKDESGQYLIGIQIGRAFSTDNVSILQGITGAVKDFKIYSTAIVDALYKLITGKLSLDNLAGPVGTVVLIGDSAKRGAMTFFNLLAMLSINLGVFNIMPFPALDGGRAVLILVEMLTGKKLPAEKEGLLNFVGLILLLTLMVVVAFKDIVTLF
ncbi:RIP metalloprotease RseP [Miniphocaeibacter halophilus]|uniref:RIP metalloprotease RseP n=1 Tax=Miniphocaeibacter halophilus TaxID=2931922 RepID=A0AC61MS44_9FIRM|nr:RIP metalloprotease RseP [Miniphocaeibacter halophilus]QQK07679.1 RIP metalloprotease RseP [Miniphocaeibacter halophilus]